MLIGKKFNYLTVLQAKSEIRTFPKGKRRIYEVYCLCECGREKWIRKEHVIHNRVVSCGCYNYLPRIRDANLRAVRRFMTYCKSSANKRGISFSLTQDEVTGLIFKDCSYCGESPRNAFQSAADKQVRKLKYAAASQAPSHGLDRVDPAIGYEISNVVPCCWTCNSMKSDMSLEEFKTHIEKIFNHFSVGVSTCRIA